MSEAIHMSDEDLRKLQLVELDILLEFDRICRKYNIKYALCGGTAIGALRHEGFIPWDDDIDLMMMRHEYEKFENVCVNELNHEKYFLQTSKTDSEYRWGYMKLRRKGTEYLRYGQEAIKCFSGVSIDIFVYDNVPDGKVGRVVYHYLRRACIKTLYSVIGAEHEKEFFKRMIYKCLKNVKKEIPLSIMEKMGRISNKKSTEYVYCMSFYRVDKFGAKDGVLHRAIKSELFESLTDYNFEGFPVLGFKNQIEYLDYHFDGEDIWAYPPEEQRRIHPPRSFYIDVDIDLREKSVEDYLNKEYIYITKEEYYNKKRIK